MSSKHRVPGSLERYIYQFQLTDIPTDPDQRWRYCTQKIASNYRWLRWCKIMHQCMILLLIAVFIALIMVVPPILILLPPLIHALCTGEYCKNDLLTVCAGVKAMQERIWLEIFTEDLLHRRIQHIGNEIIATGVISKAIANRYNQLVAAIYESEQRFYNPGNMLQLGCLLRQWDIFQHQYLIPDLPRHPLDAPVDRSSIDLSRPSPLPAPPT